MVDGDGTLIGGDDVVPQTKQVMKNLHVALAAAGASIQDLVMMTVLFVDGVDLAAAVADSLRRAQGTEDRCRAGSLDCIHKASGLAPS